MLRLPEWGLPMFYVTRIPDSMFQDIERDIKIFLKANFHQLNIEGVSVGGQFQSNNIFFSDKKTSRSEVLLDFIKAFHNILGSYGCYTTWDVRLHGHYTTFSYKGVLKGAEFKCIHYRLNELSPDGRPTGNVKYLGHMNENEFSYDQLKKMNSSILSRHKSFLNRFH